MASLFVIREKNTGAFCYSSRHRNFGPMLDNAVIFKRAENAAAAIRDMNRADSRSWLMWTLCEVDDTVWKDIFSFGKKEFIEMIENNPAQNLQRREYLETYQAAPQIALNCEVVEVKMTLVE